MQEYDKGWTLARYKLIKEHLRNIKILQSNPSFVASEDNYA